MKKKKVDDYLDDEDLEDDYDEDLEEEDSKYINEFDFSQDNTATNALHYASIVSTPSETAKHFKDMPKEARYSFFEKDEAKEIKHWDKVYRNYNYMKKVLSLQAQEDIEILNNRISLYKIKSKQDLYEYCKVNHNLISFNKIKYNDKIIIEILNYIKEMKDNGFYEDIKNQNENVTSIYSKYRKDNELPQYIDDLGMAGNIFSSSIVSMGREGNERHAQVMTINATKDIDMKKEQEERTDYKNKIGGFFNKFR